MKSGTRLSLWCLLLGFFNPAAHAEIITFDGNDVESSGAFMVTGDGGYQISDLNGLFTSDVLGWCAEACDGLQTITLKRASGAVFGLTSIDAAALWTAGDNNPVIVRGTVVGGAVVTQNLVLLNTANALKTYALIGFGNVTEVRFSKRDTSNPTDFFDFDAAIDNLVVSLNGSVADPDTDSDGVGDSLDQCANTPPDTPVNSVGCPDTDKDDVANAADICPNTPLGSKVNSAGCVDTDGDGVADADDAFPNNASESADADGDGVGDRGDYCPGTANGAQVNAQGCADSDGDGIADVDDAFPNDPFNNTGADGDIDGDGVANSVDACPGTPANTPVNAAGCADTDGDGVADTDDAFPNDASESADADGDGVGNNADQCSSTPLNTQVNTAGCPDRDGDGIADTTDNFPDDPFNGTGPNGDTDTDGVKNSLDLCPDTPVNSTVNANGCIDSDSDGVADNVDVFPNNPNESADTDGDGIGDAADPYPNAVTQKASGAVDVAIRPASPTSSCSVTTVRDEAPTVTNRPDAGYVSPSQVFFVLNGCAPGESVRVTVELAEGIPRDPKAYKVDIATKRWWLLPGAVVNYSNKTVSYDLVDGGELDADGEVNGVIVDPMIVLGSAPPDPIAEPVPLPSSMMWLLMALIGLLGSLGYWQIHGRLARVIAGAKA